MTPLLSICVPTYNRPEKFRRMLIGLLPQLTAATDLVIRDDSPNEDTKKVLDELILKFNPPCKVDYVHGEKIGLDAANLFLLERAKGKYVWWFSDDDEFLPRAIERVLSLVTQHPEITFMWMNYRDELRLAVDRPDGFFADGNEVLESLAMGNIGLLSSLLIHREKALPSLPLAKKHIKGFSFAALVPVFYLLSEKRGKNYFVRGPNFICHVSMPIEELRDAAANAKEVKNEYFNVFGVDFYDILMEFKDKLKRKSMRAILKNSFGSLWRGMLVGWIGGWDTPKGKRWKMFTYYWSFPEFWIAMPLFLLPRFVNAFLYRIYKVFFSHRTWILGRSPDAWRQL